LLRNNKTGCLKLYTVSGCELSAHFARFPSSRLINGVVNSVWCLGQLTYEGWNFNSGNYLFTTDTK